ncbi:MAG TPA: alpha-1,4-glucan--maltose-1-phosphate maltosyltransferase [Beutenbergiaceae bacterium]|nr:alpha-1,4-glucan--maltose-1-phosphate maltosyltransferase [Beutenbergiaceae bacterium]
MTTPKPAPPVPLGRIPVLNVEPTVQGGRWAAKATAGEAVPIRATVFREGHDAVAATAVLIAPDGTEHTRAPMVDVSPGNDLFEATVVPDSPGRWTFRVEGWSDPYGTWHHDATIKVHAGVDVDLMLEEGARVLERAVTQVRRDHETRQVLLDAITALRDTTRPAEARLAAGASPEVRQLLTEAPLRDFVSPSATYTLAVDRRLALYGSWYEFFPRSEGAVRDPETGQWTSGTLRTAAQRLPAIAEMGFDVVYLTPIHPIGTTNRKGRNNTLTVEPGDPGSPYAIGSPDGGHDAIHPELGTFEDFDAFVARARKLGLEVALDLALQASPDHPWVHEHPEWFTTRADGSIAYAENPPKKYQDIYPLNFDNDYPGIYAAVRDVLQTWIDHGVTAFRVDNPHTKPVRFWEEMLADVGARHPEVIFLSEAFTKPAMMHALGMVGFQQSYTYFTWRHSKEELAEYFTEVSHESAHVMRPSFWPTTHDILTPYMQQGGEAAFAIRAVLAATGSPTWGIYSGYELVENVARPGAEEQIDNEKYEFKPRDWQAARTEYGITDLITRLNAIRRRHPALQQLRNLTVHPTTDDATFCFSKRLRAEHSPTGAGDVVIVVVNVDPYTSRSAHLELDMAALGLPADATFTAHDELTGETYAWDAHPYVHLSPFGRCAHIIEVRTV